jgi:membrane-associated phospholipid phosphatase
MRDFFKKTLLNLPRSIRDHLLPVLLTIRVGGFLLAMLALWGFAEIAEDILEQESFTFDQQILLTLHDWHNPLLDQIMVGVTFWGNPSVLGVLAVVAALVLFYFKKRSEATTLIIAALGASFLNLWLKNLFARARPQLWERIVDVQLYSFPSGHAMISLVVYSMTAYVLAINFPKWRGAIALTTIPLILAIGFSRLYLGVHYPTDIIAGYAAGFVWLMACIISVELWKARRSLG